jgi:hypothetical protein
MRVPLFQPHFAQTNTGNAKVLRMSTFLYGKGTARKFKLCFAGFPQERQMDEGTDLQ